jgi:hypothetical protein
MDREKLQNHVTIVAILHIGLGALGLLVAAIVFVTLFGAGVLSADQQAFGIMAFIAIAVGGFLGILSIPGVIGGIGLLKYQSWARYLVLVLAVFHLFNVPIGTAVGVYTMWVLAQDQAVGLFSRGPAGAGEEAA